MRNVPAYKWEDILEEEVPRTFIGLELLRKEKEMEKREVERAQRKGKR